MHVVFLSFFVDVSVCFASYPRQPYGAPLLPLPAPQQSYSPQMVFAHMPSAPYYPQVYPVPYFVPVLPHNEYDYKPELLAQFHNYKYRKRYVKDGCVHVVLEGPTENATVKFESGSTYQISITKEHQPWIKLHITPFDCLVNPEFVSTGIPVVTWKDPFKVIIWQDEQGALTTYYVSELVWTILQHSPKKLMGSFIPDSFIFRDGKVCMAADVGPSSVISEVPSDRAQVTPEAKNSSSTVAQAAFDQQPEVTEYDRQHLRDLLNGVREEQPVRINVDAVLQKIEQQSALSVPTSVTNGDSTGHTESVTVEKVASAVVPAAAKKTLPPVAPKPTAPLCDPEVFPALTRQPVSSTTAPFTQKVWGNKVRVAQPNIAGKNGLQENSTVVDGIASEDLHIESPQEGSPEKGMDERVDSRKAVPTSREQWRKDGHRKLSAKERREREKEKKQQQKDLQEGSPIKHDVDVCAADFPPLSNSASESLSLAPPLPVLSTVIADQQVSSTPTKNEKGQKTLSPQEQHDTELALLNLCREYELQQVITDYEKARKKGYPISRWLTSVYVTQGCLTSEKGFWETALRHAAAVLEKGGLSDVEAEIQKELSQIAQMLLYVRGLTPEEFALLIGKPELDNVFCMAQKHSFVFGLAFLFEAVKKGALACHVDQYCPDKALNAEAHASLRLQYTALFNRVLRFIQQQEEGYKKRAQKEEKQKNLQGQQFLSAEKHEALACIFASMRGGGEPHIIRLMQGVAVRYEKTITDILSDVKLFRAKLEALEQQVSNNGERRALYLLLLEKARAMPVKDTERVVKHAICSSLQDKARQSLFDLLASCNSQIGLLLFYDLFPTPDYIEEELPGNDNDSMRHLYKMGKQLSQASSEKFSVQDLEKRISDSLQTQFVNSDYNLQTCSLFVTRALRDISDPLIREYFLVLCERVLKENKPKPECTKAYQELMTYVRSDSALMSHQWPQTSVTGDCLRKAFKELEKAPSVDVFVDLARLLVMKSPTLEGKKKIFDFAFAVVEEFYGQDPKKKAEYCIALNKLTVEILKSEAVGKNVFVPIDDEKTQQKVRQSLSTESVEQDVLIIDHDRLVQELRQGNPTLLFQALDAIGKRSNKEKDGIVPYSALFQMIAHQCVALPDVDAVQVVNAVQNTLGAFITKNTEFGSDWAEILRSEWTIYSHTILMCYKLKTGDENTMREKFISLFRCGVVDPEGFAKGVRICYQTCTKENKPRMMLIVLQEINKLPEPLKNDYLRVYQALNMEYALVEKGNFAAVETYVNRILGDPENPNVEAFKEALSTLIDQCPSVEGQQLLALNIPRVWGHIPALQEAASVCAAKATEAELTFGILEELDNPTNYEDSAYLQARLRSAFVCDDYVRVFKDIFDELLGLCERQEQKEKVLAAAAITTLTIPVGYADKETMRKRQSEVYQALLHKPLMNSAKASKVAMYHMRQGLEGLARETAGGLVRPSKK